MNYRSDWSVIRLKRLLRNAMSQESLSESFDFNNTVISAVPSSTPNYESTRISEATFTEENIDELTQNLSALNLATPLSRNPGSGELNRVRLSTRSTSDLPRTNSKNIFVPDPPDQRKRKPAIKISPPDPNPESPPKSPSYEEVSENILEDLRALDPDSEDVFEADLQLLPSDPPLPPEKMEEFNTTDRPDADLMNLFSQISIPKEILDRYQGLTIADISRLNNTSTERRAFELTLIENRNSAAAEGEKNANSRCHSDGMQSENVQVGQPSQPSQQQSANMRYSR
jgi:hypothetical protein